MLLDEPRFAALANARGLSWQDRDGFGADYAATLKRWRDALRRCGRARRARRISATSSTSLWRYYLMYCEGGFRGGAIDVAQVTMVKS